mgnify:CR=1 FL=1
MQQWAKSAPPKSDGFVAHIDAAFMQQVFDIPKRKRKSDMPHHRKADNLRAGFEVVKWRAFGHGGTLRNHFTRLKSVLSDNAGQNKIFNQGHER